jgi:uncharacterized protein (DUF2461 family)
MNSKLVSASQPCAFITDFASPLYEIEPYLNANPRSPRGSMFRIYRDVRFSGDKRPYNTADNPDYRRFDSSGDDNRNAPGSL